MKKEVVITIGPGRMDLFCHLLKAASDYCRSHYDEDAFVIGGEHGMDIFIVKTGPEDWTDYQI